MTQASVLLQKLILMLSSLVLVLICAGQPSSTDYYFISLNESHGLTNNVINDIQQDSHGFIWVATDDGLFRYDGKEFESFRTQSVADNAIPNNVIQDLFIDSANTLWILTDYGIGRFSYEKGFLKPILQGSDSLSINYKSVTSMIETPDGIFFGTFGGGISKYVNGFFEVLSADDSSSFYLENEAVSVLYQFSEHELLVGTWESGLLYYNLINKELGQVVLDDSHSRVFDIQAGPDGRVWVGTNNGLISIGESLSDIMLLNNRLNADVPKDDYLSIRFLQEEILIGTRFNGLMSIRLADFQDSQAIVPRFYRLSQDKSGPSSNTISAMYNDSKGNLWLGTHNGGINFVQNEKEAILHLDKNFSQSSLSYSNVWGLAETTNNRLLIGTDGNGIDMYDFKSHSMSRWQHNDLLRDNSVLTILVDSHDNTWVGTYKGGLLSIDSDNNSTYFEELGSTDIRCVKETKFGEIIVGTNGGGAYIYNHESRSFSLLEATKYMDVRDVVEGDNDILWLATFGNGLVRLNKKTQQIDMFNWWKKTDFAYTPIAHTIYKSENHIWLGTKQAGLVHFDMHSQQFTAYGELEGLSNSSVRSIVSDESGYLWLSTNVGVSVYNIAQRDFVNFSTSTDFQSGRFNDNSGCLLSNGRIALGGVYGLNIFSPRELIGQEVLPELILKNATIVQAETQASRNYSNSPIIERILLNHDEQFLELEFAPISYPFNDRYAVEVAFSGYNDGWQLTSENHSMVFRGLPVGKHELKYRITDGIRYGKVKRLELVIAAPWYLTKFAYVVYVMLLLGVLWLVMRYNNRQVALSEKLVFEKKSRAREQEEMEQRIRFFTNFSHEMRTPLTLITSPIEDLITKFKNSKSQLALLSIIRRNGRELTKLVNRLLEFRKLETENTILNIGHHDINILVQEEIELFQYHARHKKIEIHYATSLQLQGWLDIEKLHIVLNNLLSNSLKYVGEQGNIWIELKKEDSQLKLLFGDDGVGIDSDDLNKIFEPFFQGKNSSEVGGTGIGLSLCSSLVKAHGGTIEAEKKERGIKFSVTLPILKSAYENRMDVRFLKNQTDQEEDHLAYIENKDQDSVIVADINEKIMVIADDHHGIAEYLCSIFQQDFNVLVANDGAEALSMINKVIPDIVIADVMMPKMLGTELCKAIRSSEQTNHIPLILVTAKDGNEAKVEGYDSGADAYITKPFIADVVISRVHNLIENRSNLKKHFNNILEGKKDEEIESSEEFKFLKKVEDLILSNLDKPDFSVLTLARELGYSRTSLYRKMKALTDQSINQFIRFVKMKKSAEMLTSRNVSVSEVAFSMGFTDLKYFRSCFKEHYHKLPSEYQKSNAHDEIEIETLKKAISFK
ncbi:MAG: signal transduction histidine kinase/ligand-binding sensor domain-containing protein [Cyclobacteriaceae bacterium]|jgi:signal transduction histidine kinase/ligand-binding sensor domain-containing protein/DNA-binding response OmpR family regulator